MRRPLEWKRTGRLVADRTGQPAAAAAVEVSVGADLVPGCSFISFAAWTRVGPGGRWVWCFFCCSPSRLTAPVAVLLQSRGRSSAAHAGARARAERRDTATCSFGEASRWCVRQGVVRGIGSSTRGFNFQRWRGTIPDFSKRDLPSDDRALYLSKNRTVTQQQ